MMLYDDHLVSVPQYGLTAEAVAAVCGCEEVYKLLCKHTGRPEVPLETRVTQVLCSQQFTCNSGHESESIHESATTVVKTCRLLELLHFSMDSFLRKHLLCYN